MNAKTDRRVFSSPANRELCALAGILLAALVVYAPALNGQFLWDDLYLVNENPFFKSPIFTFEVFRHHLFLDSLSVYYRPVQNLSYMLDYWLWNQDPFGYHLSNICYHALSGFLVYLLLKKLLPALLQIGDDKTAAPIIAWLVAVIWTIHPVHNAAVAYISGRADSLATMFAVSAWLVYIRGCNTAHKPARIGLMTGAAALCLLALCSKEIALIWMALFLAYSCAFDPNKRRGRLAAATAALLAIVALYLVLRHLPASSQSSIGTEANPFSLRMLLMLRVLGDYAGLLFFPSNLHMDRIVFTPSAYASFASWQNNIGFEYLSVIGLLVLLAFVYMSFNPLPWQRLRLFGALWFVLGFLPVSNLFPLNAQVAEHWIYMPSIGFLLFLAGCVMAVPARYHAAACGAVMMAVVALGVRTAIRSEDWKDGETFYKRTIEAGGGTPRVHQNLALVYTRRGDDVSAEKVLRDTVQRFPDYATARINLGINLMRQGKVREAEPYLKYDPPAADSLAKLYPHTWSASLNLAQIRANEKRPEEALSILQDAIARSPEVWELVQLKSKLLQDNGRLPQAIVTVDEYARSHWWHYSSHLLLGRLLSLNNQLDAAREVLQQTGELDIHGVEPFNLLAHVELSEHRPIAAYEAELQAIRRDPNQPSQYLLLAAILEQLDRKEEAGKALEHAEQLRMAVNQHFRYL